jgi:hypothetical protein
MAGWVDVIIVIVIGYVAIQVLPSVLPSITSALQGGGAAAAQDPNAQPNEIQTDNNQPATPDFSADIQSLRDAINQLSVNQPAVQQAVDARAQRQAAVRIAAENARRNAARTGFIPLGQHPAPVRQAHVQDLGGLDRPGVGKPTPVPALIVPNKPVKVQQNRNNQVQVKPGKVVNNRPAAVKLKEDGNSLQTCINAGASAACCSKALARGGNIARYEIQNCKKCGNIECKGGKKKSNFAYAYYGYDDYDYDF